MNKKKKKIPILKETKKKIKIAHLRKNIVGQIEERKNNGTH